MKGIIISDISNASAPATLSVTKYGYRNKYLLATADSNTLFVTDTIEGLFVFDVKDRT